MSKILFKDSGDPWRGERLGGKAYPRKTVEAYSDEKLGNLGLKREPKPKPVPFKPTVDHVREYASITLQNMFGARDAEHLQIIVANANREAIRLIRKGAENWTAEEATRAAELEAADVAFEKVREFSNKLEVMDPIPLDYTEPKWWA